MKKWKKPLKKLLIIHNWIFPPYCPELPMWPKIENRCRKFGYVNWESYHVLTKKRVKWLGPNRKVLFIFLRKLHNKFDTHLNSQGWNESGLIFLLNGNISDWKSNAQLPWYSRLLIKRTPSMIGDRIKIYFYL